MLDVDTKELRAGKQYDSEHEKADDRFDKANAALVMSIAGRSGGIWKWILHA